MSLDEFWEEHYEARRELQPPQPNAPLVAEAAELAPGTALDLGCGRGGDAIWLAGRGWRVLAVDVSAVALELGAAAAEAAGVADAIAWERHDLAASFPAGRYDLVSTGFLHSPVEIPRGEILRRAAAAVAPGGTLVVVSHAGPASWMEPGDHPHADGLPSVAEVLEDLALGDGWTVLRSETVAHPVAAPDGTPATRPDSVIRAVRAPA